MLYEDELGIMRSIFWSQIVQVYHLPIIINLLEIPVLLDDAGILVVLKPIATFLLQFMVELCIELVVIDCFSIVQYPPTKAFRTIGLRVCSLDLFYCQACGLNNILHIQSYAF